MCVHFGRLPPPVVNDILVNHATRFLDDIPAPLCQRSNKLLWGRILVDCFDDIFAKGLKGVPGLLQLPELGLGPGPNILLWIEVSTVAWPLWQNADAPLPVCSLCRRCPKEFLPIQKDGETGPLRIASLEEWTKPLVNLLGPFLSSPWLASSHHKGKHFAGGCGKAEDLLLPGVLPILGVKPFLGPQECCFPLLRFPHVGPRCTQSFEFLPQLLWIVCEILEVTASLHQVLPRLSIPVCMQPHKLQTFLLLCICGVILGDLLLCMVTLLCETPRAKTKEEK